MRVTILTIQRKIKMFKVFDAICDGAVAVNLLYILALGVASDAIGVMTLVRHLFAVLFIFGIIYFAKAWVNSSIEQLSKMEDRRWKRLKEMDLFGKTTEELETCFTLSFGRKLPETTRSGRVLSVVQLKDQTIDDAICSWAVFSGLPHIVQENGSIWFTDDGLNWKTLEPDYDAKSGKLAILERIVKNDYAI